MEQCVVCGAEVKPEMEWCSQCYAPRDTSHPAYHGPGALESGAYQDQRFRPPPPVHDVRYSRFRGGPTSMGAFGRVLTTIGTFLLAYAIYMYVFPVMLGETGPKFMILYAVFMVPVLIVVLRRVWRASRIS